MDKNGEKNGEVFCEGRREDLLPRRLLAAAELIPSCGTVCDVGCDHGYLSIYLLQHKKARRVIAMDVNQGPLERAGENVALFGLEEQMELRRSDGLAKVAPGEADFFVCAGMGGKLIMKIMSDHPEVTASMKGALLQPQSDLRQVRRFVYALGWHIETEEIVFEEDGGGKKTGKYYPMFLIQPGQEELPPEAELAYGNLTKQKNPEVLQDFLQYQLKIKREAQEQVRNSTTERSLKRFSQLKKEIEEVEAVRLHLSARSTGIKKQKTE
ncbi:MAG: class I SAM-dependent methyltransferase [Lachnospiraceae bacterium]|nr:class I SAM-dependent methyltransferase [Lachnospiraceae bacterium]